MTRAYKSPHGPVADLDGEEWRDWEDFWEVSSHGRFKAKERDVENRRGVWHQRERLLTPQLPSGKRQVQGYRWQRDGAPFSMSIYRMMWIAFRGEVAEDQHIMCDGAMRPENLSLKLGHARSYGDRA